MDARCPDCGVTLEAVDLMISADRNPKIITGEKQDGLLGTLGFDDNKPVDTGCCPECGLVRLYAQLED